MKSYDSHKAYGKRLNQIKGPLKEALKNEYKKRVHIKEKKPPKDLNQIAKISSILG